MVSAMRVRGMSRGRLREEPGAGLGHRSPVPRLLHLQHAVGNRAVTGLVRPKAGAPTLNPIQRLAIGQPGDAYEQEADRVAAQVVSHLARPRAPGAPVQPSAQATPASADVLQRQDIPEEEELMLRANHATPVIQRQELPEEEELMLRQDRAVPTLQRQEALGEEEWVSARGPAPLPTIQRQIEEEEEELLQPSRRSTVDPVAHGVGPGSSTPSDLNRRLGHAQGGGQSLAPPVRLAFESEFGRDFAGVRVHTNTEADTLAGRLHAEAFTTGSDIFFRAGRYNPVSEPGRFLLAHELTHVVQQSE